ncbi:AbrB/MazE/SpoVT family DNA-binding domain-containing protein [Paenibacillus ehimensis]|uniref:AbrB/MazE/SpoVT family DNA-binding domain-containing protein n=1 Tax=Paenibacillus ehimensis TaxID=79264 RepID=UPI0004724982|nr:AbrB/MazE/SpoVT family DNA-binding domain-containing protein [Paenibacillus ehimensis]
MKKSTGMVRKIDHLGRIVIPMELRRTLGIDKNDPLEIFVNGEEIVLRKYAPGCSLCGRVDKPLASLYPEKTICTACVEIVLKDAIKLKADAKLKDMG